MEDLIEQGLVDWEKTVAWGAGGYYGRVFFNVAGREPRGVLPQSRYARLQDEIAAGIEATPYENEASLRTQVLRPQTAYREVRGIPPDLLVFFAGLGWRSIGTVGWNSILLHGEPAGPGTANHRPEGIFLTAPPPRGTPQSILDVREFILSELGIPRESEESDDAPSPTSTR